MKRRVDRKALAALLPRLRSRGVIVTDLLGVAVGLKPMCRSGLTSADDETLALLRLFGAGAGLTIRAYRSEYERTGKPMVMAASDPIRLEEFTACTERKLSARTRTATAEQTALMGALLGYPRCCAAAFAATEAVDAESARPWCFPRALGDAPPRISYRMNFLYNFHSRSSGPENELQRMLAGGYRLMEASLLPWIPCAWDCAPSLAYGRKIELALLGYAPELARSLRDLLSLPILFLDDWRFVTLLGARRRKDGTVAYSEIFDARTSASEETKILLRRGSALRREDGGVRVLTRGDAPGLAPDALLLRFSC